MLTSPVRALIHLKSNKYSLKQIESVAMCVSAGRTDAELSVILDDLHTHTHTHTRMRARAHTHAHETQRSNKVCILYKRVSDT